MQLLPALGKNMLAIIIIINVSIWHANKIFWLIYFLSLDDNNMTGPKDYIRQIEILSMCSNGARLSKADYAEMFGVTEITINRDIKSLRSRGVQIYSKNKILTLLEFPSKEVLIQLCADYLPLKLNSSVFKKQISLYADINKNEFFQNLTVIAKAVSDNIELSLCYRNKQNEEKKYRVKPFKLILKENNWQLLALKENEEVIKTFYLSRIKGVDFTLKKFVMKAIQKRIGEKDIQLEFDPIVENEIYDKIWFETYSINKAENGKIILNTKQPITSALAAWCISWWDTLKIIKPRALKDYCNDMIRDFQKMNS